MLENILVTSKHKQELLTQLDLPSHPSSYPVLYISGDKSPYLVSLSKEDIIAQLLPNLKKMYFFKLNIDIIEETFPSATIQYDKASTLSILKLLAPPSPDFESVAEALYYSALTKLEIDAYVHYETFTSKDLLISAPGQTIPASLSPDKTTMCLHVNDMLEYSSFPKTNKVMFLQPPSLNIRQDVLHTRLALLRNEVK